MASKKQARSKKTAKPVETPSGAAHQKVPLTVTRPELLVDGSDRQFRRLVHGLFAFFALHEAIRNSYASHLGLGGVQYTILLATRHLSQFGDVNVRDVAEYLRLSSSFITVETRKLQHLGLLDKVQTETDRRRVALTVTKKGWALLNRIAPLQQKVNDVQFAPMSETQFRELVSLVERLIESSEGALKLLHYLKAAGSDEAGSAGEWSDLEADNDEV